MSINLIRIYLYLLVLATNFQAFGSDFYSIDMVIRAEKEQNILEDNLWWESLMAVAEDKDERRPVITHYQVPPALYLLNIVHPRWKKVLLF